MKKILCFLPVLAIMLALSGCCANDVCICNDALADALYFKFQVDGPKRLWYRDIDTVYISRTNHPDTARTTSTTGKVTITTTSVLRVLPLTILAAGDTTINAAQSTLVINNAAPFASAGSTTKLDAYDYRITTRRVTKAGVVKYSFVVNNIKLGGRYNATGCCTCYENTSKQFDLSDTTHVVSTRVVTAPNDQPITTLLTR